MKRTLAVIAMVSALAVTTMSMATASYQEGDSSNTANNETQCTAVGGEFTQTGSGSERVNTCTIEFDGEPVIFENAGNSENGWATATTGTVVVEKGTGPGEVVDVDVIEACYNPGGKLMKPGSGKCPVAD
jgi:hypothetical protein